MKTDVETAIYIHAVLIHGQRLVQKSIYKLKPRWTYLQFLNRLFNFHIPRVTIRPGFPGHVLFFGLCPGIRAGFRKSAVYPGFWPNPQVHSNVANCKGVRRHETKKARQFSIQDVSNISKCNTCTSFVYMSTEQK